jgi:glycosyltransferase involved in cell wall biosynthesis
MSARAISIIIPTLNESGNIPTLMSRIAESFRSTTVRYEVVFIDDHSSDGTVAVIEKLASKYPVRVYAKIGERGKAYSLLQGFKLARYDVLCMIDADLQYPPEAIIPMYTLLEANNSDVVLTERVDEADTSKLRQLSSKVFNLAFTQFLFGFNYDSQSGLKVFRKHVTQNVMLDPTPWSFDLEFIVRALENGYKIQSYKIPFSKRLSGEAKVNVFKVTYELARASLKLRFNSSPSKIKEGYRMNLRHAKGAGAAAIAILSIAAMLAGGLRSQVAATHQNGISTSQLVMNITTVSPLAPLITAQPQVYEPVPMVSVIQPTAGSNMNGTTMAARQASTMPQAAMAMTSTQGQTSPQLVAVSAPSMATLADATYPGRSIVPSYPYSSTAATLPSSLLRLWLGGLSLMFATITGYTLYRRHTDVSHTKSVQTRSTR